MQQYWKVSGLNSQLVEELWALGDTLTDPTQLLNIRKWINPHSDSECTEIPPKVVSEPLISPITGHVYLHLGEKITTVAILLCSS